MSKTYTINIYSNNGQTTLASYSLEDSYKMTIYITEKGIEQDGAKLSSILYSYDGSGTFEGVALTANNDKADYAVKSDFTVSDSDVDLYVVESSGVKAAPPGSCYVYVDGVRIATIYDDNLAGSAITITSTGISQYGSSVYTASSEISGMEITTGSASGYIGTVVNVSESIGGLSNTYFGPTVGSYDGVYYNIYLTPVYDTPSSSSLTVTYDNTDIIDTTSDGTYTLPCSGKVMNSDIVIDAENVTSLTVTYNNNNIINASNDTHTYTLSCNGKYMNSDVGINVTIGGGSVVLHEQEGSTVYLYGAYTKTQSGSVVTLT